MSRTIEAITKHGNYGICAMRMVRIILGLFGGNYRVRTTAARHVIMVFSCPLSTLVINPPYFITISASPPRPLSGKMDSTWDVKSSSSKRAVNARAVNAIISEVLLWLPHNMELPRLLCPFSCSTVLLPLELLSFSNHLLLGVGRGFCYTYLF